MSPTLGTILECAGGSGGASGGIDNYTGPVVAGNIAGARYGSGTPPYAAPNRVAAGPYAAANAPGKCGVGTGPAFGFGSPGQQFWGDNGVLNSGLWVGGTTPYGNGNGGAIGVSGCYVDATTTGTCISPQPGKDGIVYIDVLY